MFQPFLRFWEVSQSREEQERLLRMMFQPFLRFWVKSLRPPDYVLVETVSTLLEILGLAYLALVGF